MTWGTFTNTHIGTLIFAFLFIVVIYNILVKKSRRTQILSLAALSLVAVVTIAYDMYTADEITKHLPLDLWSLGAILMPYAVLTRHKWCCNLLLLWPIQSLISLIFNYEMADSNIFTIEFASYFFSHVLTFSIPLIIFWLRLASRDHKFLGHSIAITAVVYTMVYFVNAALGTNYLYTFNPDGNIILSFLRVICPVDYWYMYLMIPIFVLYLSWWYLPEMLDHRRRTKRLRQRLKEVDKYYREYEDEYIDEILEEKYG